MAKYEAKLLMFAWKRQMSVPHVEADGRRHGLPVKDVSRCK